MLKDLINFINSLLNNMKIFIKGFIFLSVLVILALPFLFFKILGEQSTKLSNSILHFIDLTEDFIYETFY